MNALSIRIMNRIWENSRQRSNNRLMLLAIADHASDDGVAWPGMQTLAARMGGVSRRAAGNRVGWLARSGELAVFPRPGGSHDYIVLTGMSPGQVRAAYRRISARRKAPLSALIALRRKFASSASKGSSQGGAKKFSHAMRTNVRTNRQEPSIEPLETAASAAARKSIFAIWEAEARTPLTPMLGEEIGELVDTFGEAAVADAVREAMRATGPGQFGLRYVRRICERWGREGRRGGLPAPSARAVNQPPAFSAPEDASAARPITAHREVLERVAAQVTAGRGAGRDERAHT